MRSPMGTTRPPIRDSEPSTDSRGVWRIIDEVRVDRSRTVKARIGRNSVLIVLRPDSVGDLAWREQRWSVVHFSTGRERQVQRRQCEAGDLVLALEKKACAGAGEGFPVREARDVSAGVDVVDLRGASA